MSLANNRLFESDISLSSERKVSRFLLRLADTALVGFIFSSTVSITFEQASVIVAFIAWSLAMLLGHRPGYRKGLLELSFLLLFLSQLVSSLFCAHVAESLSGMRDLFFVSIVYLFAMLTRTERRMKEFIFLLVFSATLMSILGLMESAMGIQRIMATQSTPLTFSGILIITFSLGFSFAWFSASRKERAVLVPQLVIILAAIVLSNTRSSWIAIFLAILLMGILRSWKIIPALLVTTALLSVVVPTSTRSRATSVLAPSESSGYMRIELLKASPAVIRDHPVTGVGLVDLLPVYDEYVRPNVPEHLKHVRLGHFHNNLVQVAVQTGIFGLTTFLFLMFNILRSEWEGYRAAGDRFLMSVSLGSLAAFVAFSINGLFEYNFGDSEVVMLMWFTLGLSLACRRLRTCGSSAD